jgi:hypothetical protein
MQVRMTFLDTFPWNYWAAGNAINLSALVYYLYECIYYMLCDVLPSDMLHNTPSTLVYTTLTMISIIISSHLISTLTDSLLTAVTPCSSLGKRDGESVIDKAHRGGDELSRLQKKRRKDMDLLKLEEQESAGGGKKTKKEEESDGDVSVACIVYVCGGCMRVCMCLRVCVCVRVRVCVVFVCVCVHQSLVCKVL